MADLLPSLPDTSDAGSDDPKVVGVDSEEADDLLAALSSRTARRILTELHDDPAAPSALAERVDTSIQNVQYHLENLEDADIVEVVGTAYSEKGREMNVYAPSDRALVVMAGPEEETSGLKAALSRLLGSLGILALASVMLNRLLSGRTARFLGEPRARDTDAGGGGGGGASEAPTQTATETEAQSGNVTTDTVSGTSTPEPTATPTPEPAGTPTATPAGTPTSAPTGTPTSAPTGTPTPLATETPTATPAATGTPTQTPAPETTQAAVETAASAGDATTPLLTFASSPGALFFLGGATVLLGGFLWWYAQH